jgi:hypothetical protein
VVGVGRSRYNIPEVERELHRATSDRATKVKLYAGIRVTINAGGKVKAEAEI